MFARDVPRCLMISRVLSVYSSRMQKLIESKEKLNLNGKNVSTILCRVYSCKHDHAASSVTSSLIHEQIVQAHLPYTDRGKLERKHNALLSLVQTRLRCKQRN